MATADVKESYNESIVTTASSISRIVARSTNEIFRTNCYVQLQVPEGGDFEQTLTEKLWGIASKKHGVHRPEQQQQQPAMEAPQQQHVQQTIAEICNTWSQQSEIGPTTQQSLENTQPSVGQSSEDFDDIELYASAFFDHDTRKDKSTRFQPDVTDTSPTSHTKRSATQESVDGHVDDDDDDWINQAMKDMNDWTMEAEP